MKEVIVISIGGSIVVPKTGIDIKYLEKLHDLIRSEVKKGSRFILVVGGGHTAREYQRAANSVVEIDTEDVDWLGIHATRLNAHLLRTLFRDVAMKRVVKDPTRSLVWKEPVMIAAGWKPGWSTDYVAVRLAEKYKAKRILNLSNIEYAYDKDPSRYKDARPILRISWKNFRKIVGNTWSPGANAPFDPVASKLAQRLGMKVIIAKGTDLKNVKAILDGSPAKGTVISA